MLSSIALIGQLDELINAFKRQSRLNSRIVKMYFLLFCLNLIHLISARSSPEVQVDVPGDVLEVEVGHPTKLTCPVADTQPVIKNFNKC